ncbi:hypothetical protein Cgig2_011919 [Carnegiea gigantea]|uniref:HSA domain-containing protein n=1 Tax=Carnegiea gigantea TaxID=171969 RepID=A0A9Q1K499_9CARY|nr:hypothetical protein Cgig2_011919 [Carnegiea gigantea]
MGSFFKCSCLWSLYVALLEDSNFSLKYAGKNELVAMESFGNLRGNGSEALVAFQRGMHGFSSGSAFLVNAEVDSMGGVVDAGVGIVTKPSPRQAAIEKAQAELRLEYDVREERRRELEFLEKGGNPLDFRFVHAASLSVQSASHTDQHPDQFLTSEAKGSFALTASPHGDSVESSGRLGVTIACEPNSADNFDGENELLESVRKSAHTGRGSITRSQHSSQLDGSLNAKESEDSPIFHPKKGQAYRRRNRSRISRDGPRSSSTDMASRGGHFSSLSGRHAMLSKPVGSENQFEIDSEGTQALHSSTTSKASGFPEGKLEISTTKGKLVELQNQGVKAEDAFLATSTSKPDIVTGKNIVNVDVEHSCSPAEKSRDKASAAQLNESCKTNGDAKCIQTEGPTNIPAQATKGIGSESSCTQTSLRVGGNGNIGSDLCTNLKSVDSNGAPKEHELSLVEQSVYKEEILVNDKHNTNAMESGSCSKEDRNSIGHQGNGFANEDQEKIGKGRSSPLDEQKDPSNIGEQESNTHTESKSDIQAGVIEDSVPKVGSSCPVAPPPSVDPSCVELSRTDLSAPPPVSEPQSCAEHQLKIVDKEHEDRVLEEARIIKAKRKRIAELSAGLLSREQRQKSQWDFVLEEMAWLANDFAQERLWKNTAAAQICHCVALASRLRLEERNKLLTQRSVAHTVAKAVMEFWHSAGLLAKNVNNSQSEERLHDTSSKADDIEVVACGSARHDEDKLPGKEVQAVGQKRDLAICGYAVRFLQFNCSSTPPFEADLSGISHLASDIDLLEVSWQDKFTEENLFYVVPPGAMETYRRSIETCLAEPERTGNSMHEEVDTSTYDAAAELGYQENIYEEDEGENAYYLPGAFDTGKASKKKRKNMKSYAARSYESGGDFGYGSCMAKRNGTPQSVIMGKRPINSLHVGPIPTKRMRTASRQRVVLPFNAGSTGVALAPIRTDASSGDTNSFQDDHSTLHGGYTAPRGSEVDSAMDFEKLSAFDSPEMSAKPKKKKKIKHQVAAYDQRWQVDPTTHNEQLGLMVQKDLVRRRVESHQLDSNGNSGFFGQHAKKPKIMKQSLDNSFDNTMPIGGSVASPVASQMSNMSNQSKIIKLIGGRDRGRKAKALKGSARQLFQRLQGPMEEDTIKSHFEKIILIGKQLHYRKKQNDSQDLKQITPVHSSHHVALSQVIQNNVNGGILTPLDLCDVASSSQEVLPLGYQGPHAGGLALSNQGTIPPMHASSGLNTTLQGLQGSPGMGIGNSLAAPSSQFNGPRDARYAVPRSASLPIEEQQRLQHYNQMLPGRNLQPSNLPPSGGLSGNDRGVRVLPGGNGLGMMAGVNRNMPMPRPGLQGVNSSPMLNSGSMLASNMGGMPSNMNVHSGTAPGQGNSMFRSRDALHMVRPGQSSEHQRQMMLPEMQMQGAQPNSPGVPAFSALSSGFPTQTSSPSVQTFPGHQQHAMPQQHSHVQSQASSQPVTLTSLTSSAMTHVPSQLHQQQKHQVPPHGLGRSAQSGAGGMTNQVGKQRQRQAHQLQQSGRQHPQQRQQSQPQQQAKLLKGMGRGSMLMHQNLPLDTSHLNGLSTNPGAQVAEKGEPSGHLMQGQGLYSGSAPNSVQTAKPLSSPQASSHSQPQKPYANSVPTTSKQVQLMPSHLDSSNNGQFPGVPSASAGAAAPNQGHLPSVMPVVNHQQLQEQPKPSLKVLNQPHPGLQRSTQQGRQVNSDSLSHSQADHGPGPLPACVDSTNASSISSSPSNAVRKVQESQCDSSMPSSSAPSGSSSGPAVVNPSGNEPSPSVNQGLVQRQLSGNLMPQGHGAGAQWQQQQSQLQQSPALQAIKQSQKQLQQLEQSPQGVSQQEPQPQIQVGQDEAVNFARALYGGANEMMIVVPQPTDLTGCVRRDYSRSHSRWPLENIQHRPKLNLWVLSHFVIVAYISHEIDVMRSDLAHGEGLTGCWTVS